MLERARRFGWIATVVMFVAAGWGTTTATAAPTYTTDAVKPQWRVIQGAYDRGVAVSGSVVLDLKTCPVRVSRDRGTTWSTGSAAGCPDTGDVYAQRYDPTSGGAVARAKNGVLRVDASGTVIEWIPGLVGEVDADAHRLYAPSGGIGLKFWNGSTWQQCASAPGTPLSQPGFTGPSTYAVTDSKASDRIWTSPLGFVVRRLEHGLAIHSAGCASVRLVDLGACWPRMTLGVAQELVTCPAAGGGLTHHMLDLTDVANALQPAPWFIDPAPDPETDRDATYVNARWKYDDPVAEFDSRLTQGGFVWRDSQGRWIVVDDFASPGWESTWNIGSPSPQAPYMTPAQRQFMAGANAIRRRMGLPPLIFDSSTAKVAQWHADYIAVNGARPGTSFHSQQAGKPQFTGSNPMQRCWRAGIFDEMCGEIGFPSTDRYTPAQAIRQWLATPWHGQPMLTHASIGFGRGPAGAVGVMQSDQRVWWDQFPPGSILDPSAPASSRTSFVKSWPAPGQGGFPLTWAGGESPDPLADFRGRKDRVGPAFHAITADRATVTLRRARGGKLVPLLHAGRERAHYSLRLRRGAISFFAASKLDPGERYILQYRLASGRMLRVPFTTVGARYRNPRRGCRAAASVRPISIRGTTRPYRRVYVAPRSCPARAFVRYRNLEAATPGRWTAGRVLSTNTAVPMEWQLRVGRRVVAAGSIKVP